VPTTRVELWRGVWRHPDVRYGGRHKKTWCHDTVGHRRYYSPAREELVDVGMISKFWLNLIRGYIGSEHGCGNDRPMVITPTSMLSMMSTTSPLGW